jgi:hypothetical protein
MCLAPQFLAAATGQQIAQQRAASFEFDEGSSRRQTSASLPDRFRSASMLNPERERAAGIDEDGQLWWRIPMRRRLAGPSEASLSAGTGRPPDRRGTHFSRISSSRSGITGLARCPACRLPGSGRGLGYRRGRHADHWQV